MSQLMATVSALHNQMMADVDMWCYNGSNIFPIRKLQEARHAPVALDLAM
jgi:hypothetical protein